MRGEESTRNSKVRNGMVPRIYPLGDYMAEGVGFEPTVRFPVRLISSQVPSTAQPPFLCEAEEHSEKVTVVEGKGDRSEWARGRPIGPMSRIGPICHASECVVSSGSHAVKNATQTRGQPARHNLPESKRRGEVGRTTTRTIPHLRPPSANKPFPVAGRPCVGRGIRSYRRACTSAS